MKIKQINGESVNDSKSFFKAIFENSIDAIIIGAPDGVIRSANSAACKLFGYTENEIIEVGRSGILDLSDERVAALLKERDHTGKFSGEIRHKRKDGSVFPSDITSTVFKFESGKEHTITIIRDITLQKDSDYFLSSSNELLGIINKASSKIELIRSVTGFLNTIFGFEASGIRLKDGDDFPYYQTSGFSDDFVLKERSLCSYDEGGELLRDADGNPVLECMCGNVICGRFDPAKPFFTERGSFWSNSTSELLASTSDEDRQSRTRNRCSGEGYESLGLFPLRSGNSTIGLLQLNDHRKGVFTPAKISVLEILGDNISIALDKFNVKEALMQSEEKYRLLSEHSGVGVGLYSKDGIILYYNSKALKNLGGKAEDFVGKSLLEVFGKKDGKKYLNRVKESIRLRINLVFEDHFTSPSGTYWFASSHSLYSNSNGEVIGVQVVSHDISERKLFESQLIQTTTELRELTRHLVEVREEERTAIARDLHDDLGQKLTALNMDISWLKARIGVQSHNVENKLNQMVQVINNTIESTQKISYGLRPSILDDLGLIPAIEWQITDFHKSSGISCNYSCSPNDISVDAKISLVVFRVVQEALTNIARHSGATKASIKISLANGILEIVIKDNGSGVNQQKLNSNKSFGLIGMRERVKIVNGDISITGNEGEGTRVEVRIAVGTGNRQ